jgi:hypothetical protein
LRRAISSALAVLPATGKCGSSSNHGMRVSTKYCFCGFSSAGRSRLPSAKSISSLPIAWKVSGVPHRLQKPRSAASELR